MRTFPEHRARWRRLSTAVVMWGMLLGAACSGSENAGTEPLPTSTLPPTLTPTPTPPSYWIQPGVPTSLVERVAPVLADARFAQAEGPDTASVRIVLDPGPEAALTAQWLYTPAAPFPTIPDNISFAALRSYWSGDLSALPEFGVPPGMILPEDAADVLAARFGPPGSGVPVTRVEATESEQMASLAWGARPSIAILPFEMLDARWKVLALDGHSVLDKNLDLSAYPLTVHVGVVPANEAGAEAIALLQSSGAWQATNRDPAKMTIVVMTGVTALARATAWHMEAYGLDFPARNIVPFFADADILHTSNEVSFSPECPAPELIGEAKFCSSPRYIDLLLGIGLDVVELTGNHVNDWGTSALSYTLDIYDQNGIATYGGGRDLTESTTPRIITAPDGTRIAFVGCNSAGPYSAWATDFTPGAAPCSDWAGFRQQIADLKSTGQADVVIATLQYTEIPAYGPTDAQRADFEALALAGADIVSGSQAHQPQGFSFPGSGFVHFGVGNLFFDQMDYIENRQMFADKHIFYEGRHISTVLFTGMMEDYSQPRPMTPEERAEFLAVIFGASGW